MGAKTIGALLCCLALTACGGSSSDNSTAAAPQPTGNCVTTPMLGSATFGSGCFK